MIDLGERVFSRGTGLFPIHCLPRNCQKFHLAGPCTVVSHIIIHIVCSSFVCLPYCLLCMLSVLEIQTKVSHMAIPLDVGIVVLGAAKKYLLFLSLLLSCLISIVLCVSPELSLFSILDPLE